MFSDPHLSRGVHRKLVDLGVEIGVRSISCWKASIVTDLETARFTEPKTHRSRVEGPGGSRFGSIWSSILNSYRSRCRNPFCDGSRAVIQNRTDLETFEKNRDRSQEYPYFLKKSGVATAEPHGWLIRSMSRPLIRLRQSSERKVKNKGYS